MQALDQIVRRQVDDLDVVGEVDDGVGHRLAHPDAGDLRDDVVEAFDMLDVQRRVDVDTAIEQFLDVEIALRMAAALGVGMGEFVDQNECRPFAGEDGVEIHLVEQAAFVFDGVRGMISKPSTSASVSLRPWVSTTPITTSTPSAFGAAGDEHFIGLADARRGAEKYLQTAARLAPGAFSNSASGEGLPAWHRGRLASCHLSFGKLPGVI
jgi:hypothetical protein